MDAMEAQARQAWRSLPASVRAACGEGMRVSGPGAHVDAEYGCCAYCGQFSYHVITRGACGDCRARWDAFPATAPRWYGSDTQADAVYVVTTSREAVAGPGSVDGLRRHSLREARDAYRLAADAHMVPRIVHAVTLQVVTEAGADLGAGVA